MPQLDHRDPAIIGLLGAGGPYSTADLGNVSIQSSYSSSTSASTPSGQQKNINILTLGDTSSPHHPSSPVGHDSPHADGHRSRDVSAGTAEALADILTPPQTPQILASRSSSPLRSPLATWDNEWGRKWRTGMPSLAPGDVFARPYYGLIVDGIHLHPNSVRVGSRILCPMN
jgi:N-acetylglucosamine-6-phosphate deacetylase